MKKLLRNSLIASVVTVAGVVSGANNAMAVDSDPIEFTGTIPGSCTFGTPTSGTLLEYTEQSVTVANLYSNKSAEISLTCNTGATIEVKGFQEEIPIGMTINKDRNVSTQEGWLIEVTDESDNDTRLYPDGSKSEAIIKLNAFEEDLTVRLDVYYEETSLKPGTYTYRTTITATPL
ncbi:MAG: hypothetical protein AAGG00_12900 [Cyanobacteria bacterium P01_H01_bin.150]